MSAEPEFDAMLRTKLAAVAEQGSENRLIASQVRELVLEYLQFLEEEIGRFPELSGKRHWNLWMADYDLSREAFFVAISFTLSGLEIMIGRGDHDAIRAFSESEFPEELDDLNSELQRRFRWCQQLTVPHPTAVAWLGRRFPPLE